MNYSFRPYLFLLLFVSLYLPCHAQKYLWGVTKYGGTDDGGVIFRTDSAGNNQTIVYNFSRPLARSPQYTHLIQGSDGKIYGMTEAGGLSNKGLVFCFDPITRAFTNLVHFQGTNGSGPQGSLFQASNGSIYGMTRTGGANNYGT
ncbi:MAG: choice-of-anchor tandem repeat GloVer-containing protein, partial [Bacteroidota bacterium]